MSRAEKGIVAAGHPLTAQAGARVLREGGNAVDAAVAAMLRSSRREQLLRGRGAGGYLLVAGGGLEPTLLDFFVQAPSRVGDGSEAELLRIDVSFGDAEQVFHIGPASCGVFGAPAGVCEAMRRWGTVPLEELAAPARPGGGDAPRRAGPRSGRPSWSCGARPGRGGRGGRRTGASCARGRCS